MSLNKVTYVDGTTVIGAQNLNDIQDSILELEQGGTVDSSLSATSENPVQNKVIKAALDLKADSAELAAVATSGSYSDLSNTPTIPTVPQNVSAFTNDAGYLKQHQSLAAYQTKAITDTGGYFTTDTVDGALQEIGAELASKIGKNDDAVFVTMTSIGNTVTCFSGFAEIYLLFSTQQKTYFVLANSQTDVQVFDVAHVDIGNQTIYLSSIVRGVLFQIVLTPGGSSTMTGTLTTIDLNLQNAGKTPRIAMTGADTAPTLDPNKLYVFPEMASLAITLAAIADSSIVNEYHFIFVSGSTATTTTFPAIPGLDDFAAEANMAYEVSILEGRALVISWEVSA